MSMSRIGPIDLTCEISDVSSEKLCCNACFMRRIEGKIEQKMVVLEVVETRDTIELCVKLEYRPSEMFNLLQRD